MKLPVSRIVIRKVLEIQSLYWKIDKQILRTWKICHLSDKENFLFLSNLSNILKVKLSMFQLRKYHLRLKFLKLKNKKCRCPLHPQNISTIFMKVTIIQKLLTYLKRIGKLEMNGIKMIKFIENPNTKMNKFTESLSTKMNQSKVVLWRIIQAFKAWETGANLVKTIGMYRLRTFQLKNLKSFTNKKLTKLLFTSIKSTKDHNNRLNLN